MKRSASGGGGAQQGRKDGRDLRSATGVNTTRSPTRSIRENKTADRSRKRSREDEWKGHGRAAVGSNTKLTCEFKALYMR